MDMIIRAERGVAPLESPSASPEGDPHMTRSGPDVPQRKPRGRPPLPAEARRTRRSVVCLTEAEAAEVAERAAAARLAPAAYMRRRALGRPVRRAVVRRLGAAELRELNRIGVNLNQIARVLNAGAGAPSGTRAALERCHEAVRVLLRREAGIP